MLCCGVQHCVVSCVAGSAKRPPHGEWKSHAPCVQRHRSLGVVILEEQEKKQNRMLHHRAEKEMISISKGLQRRKCSLSFPIECQESLLWHCRTVIPILRSGGWQSLEGADWASDKGVK